MGSVKLRLFRCPFGVPARQLQAIADKKEKQDTPELISHYLSLVGFSCSSQFVLNHFNPNWRFWLGSQQGLTACAALGAAVSDMLIPDACLGTNQFAMSICSVDQWKQQDEVPRNQHTQFVSVVSHCQPYHLCADQSATRWISSVLPWSRVFK